jgi:hypothetical protein
MEIQSSTLRLWIYHLVINLLLYLHSLIFETGKDSEVTMKLIKTDSLGGTIDNISDALFFNTGIPREEKAKAVIWISERQGLKGSYAGMFAPFPEDFMGIKLFSGESVKSKAAISHILGEESLRVLKLLGLPNKHVVNAFKLANQNMVDRLNESNAKGRYCCGTCTGALWRNLVAGNLADQERHLNAGLRHLKECRDGNGKWRSYPYYHTLLALEEIAESNYSPKGLISEMKYAAGGLEKLMKRKSARDKYDARRQALAERILNRI